jgi:hypothetical protein
LKPQHTILEELREIAPSLMEIGTKMPFHIEEGYFEQFPETVLEKANMGLLSNIQKQSFHVPDQYFNGLADQILLKAKAADLAERAKVIPMRRLRNLVTYLAAAMLTGIMITGSFMFSDKKQANDFEQYKSLDIPSTLDQVTESDLNAYLEKNQNVSSEDLPENETATLPKTNEKIQNLSNENLHNYLNENGDLEPNAVVDPEN